MRFQIEKDRLGNGSARIQLKCVAKIKEVPEATKETTATIFVPSLEKLRKQMSLNYRSTGKSLSLASGVAMSGKGKK